MGNVNKQLLKVLFSNSILNLNCTNVLGLISMMMNLKQIILKRYRPPKKVTQKKLSLLFSIRIKYIMNIFIMPKLCPFTKNRITIPLFYVILVSFQVIGTFYFGYLNNSHFSLSNRIILIIIKYFLTLSQICLCNSKAPIYAANAFSNYFQINCLFFMIYYLPRNS